MAQPRKRATARDPNAFDLDAYDRTVSRKPFSFNWGGKSWTIPNLNDLDVFGILRAIKENGDEAVQAAIVLEIAFGDQYDAIVKAKPMGADTLNALFEQYQRHSGVEPGELPASPPS